MALLLLTACSTTKKLSKVEEHQKLQVNDSSKTSNKLMLDIQEMLKEFQKIKEATNDDSLTVDILTEVTDTTKRTTIKAHLTKKSKEKTTQSLETKSEETKVNESVESSESLKASVQEDAQQKETEKEVKRSIPWFELMLVFLALAAILYKLYKQFKQK